MLKCSIKCTLLPNFNLTENSISWILEFHKLLTLCHVKNYVKCEISSNSACQLENWCIFVQSSSNLSKDIFSLMNCRKGQEDEYLPIFSQLFFSLKKSPILIVLKKEKKLFKYKIVKLIWFISQKKLPQKLQILSLCHTKTRDLSSHSVISRDGGFHWK